ncbi:plant intracellular Ras-group-related LRR protein 5-like [Papaver somniferum]|uniref:plant intracellular Ras-group-related LRR protein 5-like n=1 Tax=Papaver somniferum TaxID=3469 RepID=UPI000E703657|nr:plant intracellular Ras-group-related LRR protein 5-like [Papaver somniferum]
MHDLVHDLVHDLAEEVRGENELAALKASEFTDVSKVRRLRLELDEDISKTFLKKLSNAKKLRTIFAPEGSNVDPLIFSRNNNLRVLHAVLSPNFTFPKLSSLSLNLRHLRYLRLNSLDMRNVSNGQSIGKLYNLETLVFTNFYGVQNLLTNIHSLQKLGYLEVSWTVMEELPDSVTSLCNLQTLDLNNCELKVIPDSISGLKNLTSLNLSYNPFEELPVSIITLSSLQTLDVNTCNNLKVLPEFVSDLCNLQIFDFRNCPLLKALPIDFGSLTQLRSLNLVGTEITLLPEPCSNLENLEFVNFSLCESPKDVKNWAKVRKFYHNPLGNPTILGIGKLVCLEELYYMVPEKQPECDVGIQDLGIGKLVWA